MDLLTSLQYQLTILSLFLQEINKHIEQGAPAEDSLALIDHIREQRKISKALVARAHLIGATHKPSISLN